MLGFFGFSFIMIILIPFVIFIALMLLLFVYSTPYYFWVGYQNEKGLHLDKKDEGLGTATVNATKLYRSIFTHKPAF